MHDQEIHERAEHSAADRLGRQGRATSEWQPKIEAVGTLRAVKGADLSLEVSGVVDSISLQFRRRRRGKARRF